MNNQETINETLPKSPDAYSNPKAEFNQAVASTTFDNWQHSIDLAFKYLEDCSYRNILPKLRNILENNTGPDDKLDRIANYIATNCQKKNEKDHFGFSGYRFIGYRYDKNLKEISIRQHITRLEARSFLYLAEINRVWKGKLCDATRGKIDRDIYIYNYIQKLKETKTLSEIKATESEIVEKYGKDLKKLYKGKYPLTERGERKKIISALIQWLTQNPGECTVKHGRVFSPWARTARIYRANEMPFVIKEYDIQSSFPQLIDYHFGFNRCKTVYSNLMEAYSISRDQAKVKFNAMLNTWQAKRWQAEKVYKAAGYSDNEAKQISALTAEKTKEQKGHFSSVIVPKESEIMRRFKELNFKDQPGQFLFDSYGYEADFVDDERHVKITKKEVGADFGFSFSRKARINLDLKIETGSLEMTLSDVTEGKFKQVWYPNGMPVERYNNGSFFIFDRNFKKLNANFDITAPVFEKVEIDGKKISKGRPVGEMDFLARLEKLYHILLYFNGDKKLVKRLFYRSIDNLLDKPGISFSRNYIEAYFERISLEPQDALQYCVMTDLSYRGEPLKHSTFQKLKFEAIGEMLQLEDNVILRKEIRKLITDFENNDKIRFIKKSKFKRSRSTKTTEYINKIHELLSLKTYCQYSIYNNLVPLFAHLKETSLLGCVKTGTSIREKALELNVNRKHLTRAVKIQQHKEQIISSLENAIANLQDLTEEDQLFDNPVKQMPIKQPISNEGRTVIQKGNLTIEKYDITKWDQNLEVVKLAYKGYIMPFFRYAEAFYRDRSA